MTGKSGLNESAGSGGSNGDHGECRNCGGALIGDFCHQCGQAAHVHRSVAGLLHDMAHGVFHFEGRIWATLPLLVGRPGELTRRYIAGERMRFVSPLALFLFSVFLMFASYGLIGGPFVPDDLEIRPSAPPTAVTARARTAVPGQTSRIETGWESFDRRASHAFENPKLFAYKLQSNGYKFSWALIPISLPFIWLLFAWRPGFGMYDHAVFATYSLAFMTLLAISAAVIARIPGIRSVDSLVLLVPPMHMFAQLRGAYGLRKWQALWRTAALCIFALIAGFVFFLLLIALGI